MPRNIFVLSCAIATLVFVAGCAKAPPANVAATVNGRPVTYAELEKQFQAQFPPSGGGTAGQGSSSAPTNDDQVQFQKLEILRSLIDSEIMLQRAEKSNLLATDTDVDAKLNELKAPYTQEEFQRQLNLRKMSLDDLKAQLRRDLSVQKLFNKEITSNINITDKDVSDFYAANQKSFNLAEPQIHLAQILVTAVPDPNVRNLKNDKAQNDEQAHRKAETLLARIRQGEDFAQLAQNYSEDPQTLGTGGDLGFVPAVGARPRESRTQKAGSQHTDRPGVGRHQNTGRLPDFQGAREAAAGSAGPDGPQCAAADSGDAHQPQGPASAVRVHRSRTERGEGGQLPCAKHRPGAGEEVDGLRFDLHW